jgi:predicted ATP-dependent serine protease
LEVKLSSLTDALLQKNTLMIYGKSGVGKSLLMNKISTYLAEKGEKVLYIFNHPSAISNLSVGTERIVLLSMDSSSLTNSLILAGNAIRRGFRLIVVDEISWDFLHSIASMRSILLGISLLSNLAKSFSRTLVLVSDEEQASLKLVSKYVDSIVRVNRSGNMIFLEWSTGTKLLFKLF